MASFMTVLKKIGSIAATVEHGVAPVAEALLPQFASEIAAVDNIVQKVQGGILAAENTGMTGDQKANSVIAAFEASLADVQSFAAAAGYKATYDVASLNNAITAGVAMFNALATVKASYSLVKA